MTSTINNRVSYDVTKFFYICQLFYEIMIKNNFIRVTNDLDIRKESVIY